MARGGGLIMGFPQLIVIGLLIGDIVISLCSHGETMKISFWTTCLNVVLWSALLIVGGFFK